MKGEDIYKTKLCTRYGKYEFVVVPFGPTNAPNTFTCLINSVLCPHLDNFVIVCVDDILVYSKNENEHADHLVAVLRLFRKHKLYAKIIKCISFQYKIHYLGHVDSKEGITLDLENFKAIMEWLASKNVDEFGSFMGLVDYYMRFIKNFSKIR